MCCFLFRCLFCTWCLFHSTHFSCLNIKIINIVHLYTTTLNRWRLEVIDRNVLEQGWPNFLDRGPHHIIRFFSLSWRYVLWCFKKALRLTCEQGRCAPWNSVAQRIKNQRKWQLWRWCMMDVGLFWVVSGGSTSKTLVDLWSLVFQQNFIPLNRC